MAFHWFIRLLILSRLVFVKVSTYDTNLDMTEDELQAVFGHTSRVPDYEIVTIERTENRLRRESTSSHMYRLVIHSKQGLMDIRLYQQRELVQSTVTVISRDENGESKRILPPPECVFRGEMDNGIAALSSCDDNGMTGLMITPNDTYVIKPVPKRARQRRSASMPSNSHIFYKVTSEMFPFVIQETFKYRHLRFPRFASKRHVHKNKTIETGVIVDDKMYNILSKGEDDPDAAIFNHVFAIMHAVQLLYSHPTMSVKVNLVIVKIIILKSATAGPKKENGDIHEYLRRFSEWQEKENADGDFAPEHWDHAIMLSGLDLYMKTPENRVVIGLAWVSGMCNKRYSASLNEGLTMEAVLVLGHEMGHNLGMQHDGTDNDCAPNKYIMSASLGPGKTGWSECSNKYLEEFLSTEVAKCLNDHANSQPDLDYKAGTLPGKLFPADAQCHLAFGKKFNKYNLDESPFDDICRELWCSNKTTAKRAHPALYGTNCGKYKICIHGECIQEKVERKRDTVAIDESTSIETSIEDLNVVDNVKSVIDKDLQKLLTDPVT